VDLEQKYTLKELLYPVLKGWRLLLILPIILSFATGFFAYTNNKNMTFTAEEIHQQQKTLLEKNADAKSLVAKIEADQKSLASKQDYLKQSLLMKIDPYAQAEAQAPVSISLITSSQISDQQQQVLKSALTDKYLQTKTQDELYKFINTSLAANYPVTYLEEIVTITSDNPGNLTVRVVFTETQTATSMVHAVFEYWQVYANANLQMAAPHELQMMTLNTNVAANPDLTKLRASQDAAIRNLQASIKSSETEIIEIVMTELRKNAYKSVPLHIIIGAILGFMISVFSILFRKFVDPNIRDESFTHKRLGLFVLGTIKVPNTKKDRRNRVTKAIDTWIDKTFGNETPQFSREDSIRYIYASLLNVAANTHNTAPADPRKLLCLSFSSPEDASAMVSEILAQAKHDGFAHMLDLLIGGDLLTSPETMLKLNDSQAVLLIEKLNSAKYARIEKGLAVLKQMGKKVAGVILFE